MKLSALLLSTVLILSSCASFVTNERSQYANSWHLETKQPIVVPAGSSFAYVKATGQVVRRKEIGTYELYCKFLVPRSKESGETTINPDTFKIHGIHKRFTQNQRNSTEYQLAFNGVFRNNGNGVTQRDLELFFNISSTKQPHVKSMSCIRFSDPVFYNIPTLEEVQVLFGQLAQFTPG